VAKRKYTRKQLKQPDKFLTTSDRAWNFIKDHTRQVLVMVAVAVVGVAAAWIWTYFADNRARDITGKLTYALKVYSKPVVELKATLPKDPDGIPLFGTKAKKLEASAKELSKVVYGSSSGSLNIIATLIRAGVHYDGGQYTEAIRDYSAVQNETSDPQLREMAIEGLVYCYESTKALDKALETVKKLSRDGDKQYYSMYQEARLLTLKGQKVQAAKLYQKILEKSGSDSLSEKANERLALLESK